MFSCNKFNPDLLLLLIYFIYIYIYIFFEKILIYTLYYINQDGSDKKKKKGQFSRSVHIY